jgi:hypothetical protein
MNIDQSNSTWYRHPSGALRPSDMHAWSEKLSHITSLVLVALPGLQPKLFLYWTSCISATHFGGTVTKRHKNAYFGCNHAFSKKKSASHILARRLLQEVYYLIQQKCDALRWNCIDKAQ